MLLPARISLRFPSKLSLDTGTIEHFATANCPEVFPGAGGGGNWRFCTTQGVRAGGLAGMVRVLPVLPWGNTLAGMGQIAMLGVLFVLGLGWALQGRAERQGRRLAFWEGLLFGLLLTLAGLLLWLSGLYP